MLVNALPVLQQRVLQVFLGVLLLSFCAQITIPIGVIPITMQTIAVMFIALFYDKVTAPLTLLSYLTLGFSGVPIFANYSSGLTKLFGPAGGYYIGYMIAVYLMVNLRDRIKLHNKALQYVLLCIIGNVMIMGCGWLWLSRFVGVHQAFYSGVAVFIVPAILKSALLVLLVRWIRPVSQE